jgi:hypothetical protein
MHGIMPDAVKAISNCALWRGWSKTDQDVHCACYQAEAMERLDAIMDWPGIEGLIAEFDRRWSGRATRTHEVIVIAAEMGEQNHGRPENLSILPGG